MSYDFSNKDQAALLAELLVENEQLKKKLRNYELLQEDRKVLTDELVLAQQQIKDLYAENKQVCCFFFLPPPPQCIIFVSDWS